MARFRYQSNEEAVEITLYRGTLKCEYFTIIVEEELPPRERRSDSPIKRVEAIPGKKYNFPRSEDIPPTVRNPRERHCYDDDDDTMD